MTINKDSKKKKRVRFCVRSNIIVVACVLQGIEHMFEPFEGEKALRPRPLYRRPLGDTWELEPGLSPARLTPCCLGSECV
jgi:hypothetical protein